MLLAWIDSELILHDRFMHVLVCGVHEDYTSAAAHQNHLTKLRGARSTQIRQDLAAFCGVKVGLELERLRHAKRTLAAVAADEEGEAAVAPSLAAGSHAKSGSERDEGRKGRGASERGHSPDSLEAPRHRSMGMVGIAAAAAAAWALVSLVCVHTARKKRLLMRAP